MDLTARKAPKQERSKALVSFILQAATRVLERDGLGGFNTNAVAEAAGISIGSLYQYFPNKSALILALIEQNQTQQQQALEALITNNATSSIRKKIDALVQFAIAHQFGNPMLAAALDHEERRLPIGDQLKAAEQQLVQSIYKFLRMSDPSTSHKITRQAVGDCLVIAKAMVEAETIDIKNHGALAKRMNRALLGYLQLS